MDKNKDKRVCETDLFNTIKSLESFETSDIIIPDVMIGLRYIEELRNSQGKSDPHKLRFHQIDENVKVAMKSKSQVARKNVNEDVKQFLREVQWHQEKQRVELLLAADPLDLDLAKKLEDMEGPEKKVIPLAMKPFMNKQINFSLFVDLLSDKVDN